VQVATLTPATGAPTAAGSTAPPKSPQALAITEFKIGAGQGPHDVAPAVDGGVWYTAQRSGELGWLDPDSGEYEMTKLGTGSAPHGVIVGPDGNAWVTDGGLNSIVRVDAKTKAVTRYALPADRRNANLNTATFDRNGTLWFTGQNGIYGKLDPRTGAMAVFDSPRGRGPYGIATCADGSVYYASLASSFIGRVNVETGTVEVIEPTTAGQGARRVWCDSKSNIWVSEWNVGSLARYCSTCRPAWTEWKLPGVRPMAYAVYVDEADIVWITDFGANALVRFDPATQTFTSLPHSAPSANVRQLLGRAGEVWGALSGQDKLMVVRTR
jgi:virginiamycin B lyase